MSDVDKLKKEIDSLKQVLDAVSAFHDLATKERDWERTRNTVLQLEIEEWKNKFIKLELELTKTKKQLSDMHALTRWDINDSIDKYEVPMYQSSYGCWLRWDDVNKILETK